MNVVLWILAILLAGSFAAAGLFKLTQSRVALAGKGMGWTEDFTDGQVRAIGAVELLGAIGLIVPGATKIAPVLTPIAALCLAAVMAGAVVVHLRRKETPVPPAVLGVLALVLAILRFGPFHF